MQQAAIKQKNEFLTSPFAYILIVGGTVVLGFLSGLLSGAHAGFENYTRPPLTPPPLVFAIIWPVMYFLIGNSFYYILKTFASAASIRVRASAIVFWASGFALCLAWPFVFFTADLHVVALIIITFITALAIAQTVMTFMFSRISSYLMMPYVAWLLFATYLNIFISLVN